MKRLLLSLMVALSLLVPPALWAASAIVRDGNCSASATSCTLSATTTGSLKIVFAFHNNSTTVPSLPTGWTSINTGATAASGTTGAIRVGCNVSSSAADTGTGAWTSATLVIAISYSKTNAGTTANCNTTGIGGNALANAKTSTTITYTGITLTDTSGNSYVVGFAGDSAAVPGVPTGMFSVTSIGTAPAGIGSDTNAGVASWTTQTVTVTSSTWLSAVLEVRQQQVATPTASLAAGAYVGPQSESLSDTTASAVLCYTTDGTAPTATTPGTCLHGTTYSVAFILPTTTLTLAPIAQTIKVLGTLANFTNSAVLTVAYTFNASFSFMPAMGVGIGGPLKVFTMAASYPTFSSGTSVATTNCPGSTFCFSLPVTSTTAGDVMVLAVLIDQNATVTLQGCFDGGDAFTVLSSTNFNGSGGGNTGICWISSISSGKTTVYVGANTSSGAISVSITAFEFSVTGGAVFLDGSGSADLPTSSTTHLGMAPSITGGSEFILQLMFCGSSVSTIDTGYTLLTPSGNGVAYLLNSNNSAQPTWTQSPAATDNIAYATFK